LTTTRDTVRPSRLVRAYRRHDNPANYPQRRLIEVFSDALSLRTTLGVDLLRFGGHLATEINEEEKGCPEPDHRIRRRSVARPSGWYALRTKNVPKIATELGVTAETLRNWVKQDEIDAGERRTVTTEEREELRRLRREEVKVLRLVVDALEMAVWRRKPKAGLVHHSDRGVQYTALSFGKKLEEAGIVPSMGRAQVGPGERHLGVFRVDPQMRACPWASLPHAGGRQERRLGVLRNVLQP
jgi:transposase